MHSTSSGRRNNAGWIAQEITDAHEGPHPDGSRDPEEEKNMDLHNNTVGRQMARFTTDPNNCWGLAVNADMAGALSIINDNGIDPSQPSSK